MTNFYQLVIILIISAIQLNGVDGVIVLNHRNQRRTLSDRQFAINIQNGHVSQVLVGNNGLQEVWMPVQQYLGHQNIQNQVPMTQMHVPTVQPGQPGFIVVLNHRNKVRRLSQRQFEINMQNGHVSHVLAQNGDQQFWLPINEMLTPNNAASPVHLHINGGFTTNPATQTICAPFVMQPGTVAQPTFTNGWVPGTACIGPATLVSTIPATPPGTAPQPLFCTPGQLTGSLTMGAQPVGPQFDWNGIETAFNQQLLMQMCHGYYDPNDPLEDHSL